MNNGFKHNYQAQRGNGKVNALNLQCEVAHGQPQKRTQGRRRDNADPKRDAKRVEQKGRQINAAAEKCRRPEVDVAGVATQYIPARGNDNVLDNDITGEKVERVGDDRRGKKAGKQNQECAQRENDVVAFHRVAPKSPCGRRPSARSRMAKATPGDHEGVK